MRGAFSSGLLASLLACLSPPPSVQAQVRQPRFPSDLSLTGRRALFQTQNHPFFNSGIGGAGFLPTATGLASRVIGRRGFRRDRLRNGENHSADPTDPPGCPHGHETSPPRVPAQGDIADEVPGAGAAVTTLCGTAPLGECPESSLLGCS